MKILFTLLLVNAIAGALAFAPTSTRVTREPDTSVIRINEETKSLPKTTITSLQIATSSSSPPSNADLYRKVIGGYKWLSNENYLTLAFIQAAILASGADVLTQSMESGTVDYIHVAAMATIASTMSGTFNAICLRELEDEFPGKSNKHVAIKTIIHATIIASVINSAYLAGVPLLSNYIYPGAGLPDDPLAAWNMAEFITLTKLEVAMFIPYNTLAFAFVPVEVRPLTHAAISATFNIAVSAVTLGYFDEWCHRAANIMIGQ